MWVLQIIEVVAYAALFVSAVNHLNRMHQRPWHEVASFAAVVACSLGAMASPEWRAGLLAAVAVVFARQFFCDRRRASRPMAMCGGLFCRDP